MLRNIIQGLRLGVLLWTWQWTFGFHKRRRISWAGDWRL